MQPDPLSTPDVRERAAAGAMVLGLRSLAVRLLSFVGNIALARLLVPEDFGLVAIGIVVMMFANAVTDGGMATGLIRRREPPTLQELQGMLFIQLAIASALAGVVAVVGVYSGRSGQVAALVTVAIPFVAFRAPGAVLLERAMNFRPVAAVEVVETVAFFGWAAGTAALGAGVWGLASAFVVRAAAGSLTMARFTPRAALFPRPNLRAVRPLLRFGLTFQTEGLIRLGREQGFNLGIGAIGGLAILGYWVMAFRITNIAAVVFDALHRVSLPAMVEALRGDERDRRVIERALESAGVLVGASAVCLVAPAPALVPAAFGEQWTPINEIVPWAGAGVLLAMPVSTVAVGYLLARGNARAVLSATVGHAIVRLSMTFALLPPLGATAVGVGLLAGGLTEGVLLGRAMRRCAGARFLRHLVRPTTAAAAGCATGWAVCTRLPETLPAALVGLSAGAACFAAILLALDRRLVFAHVDLVKRAGRVALARRR